MDFVHINTNSIPENRGGTNSSPEITNRPHKQHRPPFPGQIAEKAQAEKHSLNPLR
jgi:hypothetical protein